MLFSLMPAACFITKKLQRIFRKQKNILVSSRVIQEKYYTTIIQINNWHSIPWATKEENNNDSLWKSARKLKFNTIDLTVDKTLMIISG